MTSFRMSKEGRRPNLILLDSNYPIDNAFIIAFENGFECTDYGTTAELK